jgi:cyanate permease
MSTVLSLLSPILGMVSGGWGSVAAIVALFGLILFLGWKYTQWKEEQAAHETQSTAAIDQGAVASGNQTVQGQMNSDDAANQAALNQALHPKDPPK